MARSSVHSAAVYQGTMPRTEGFEDPDLAVWVPAGAVRSYATFFGGSDQFLDDDVTGEDPYAHSAPEVPGVVNTRGVAHLGADPGEKIRRLRLEELTIRCRVRAPATGGSFASLPWHVFFESCSVMLESATPTSTVAAGGAGGHFGEFTVEAGQGANFFVGEVLERVINGVVHYAAVTGINVDTITVTGEWPAAVTDGETIRHCRTYAGRTAAVPPEKLINVRFDSDGIAHYLFNGVCTGFQTVIEEGVLSIDFTVRPADQVAVQSTDPTTSVYARPGTPSASPLQSCRRWTPAALADAVAPAHETLEHMDVTEYGFGVSFDVTPDGGCGALISEGGATITRSTVSMTGTTFDVAPFDRSFINGVERQIVHGYGPPGQGAAFFLMNGHQPEPEERTSTDRNQQQVSFSYRNGGWTGDEVVANGIANTSWRVGFPIPDAA